MDQKEIERKVAPFREHLNERVKKCYTNICKGEVGGYYLHVVDEPWCTNHNYLCPFNKEGVPFSFCQLGHLEQYQLDLRKSYKKSKFDF